MLLDAAAFVAKWNDQFPDNDTFNISAGDLRDLVQDLVDSLAPMKAVAAVNVPGYVPDIFYPAGFVILESVADGEPAIFLQADHAGYLAAPTQDAAAEAGDGNWRPALEPQPDTRLSQSGSVYAFRALAGRFVPGRQLVIIGRRTSGPGRGFALPDVYIDALNEYQLKPRGYTMVGNDPSTRQQVNYSLADDQATDVPTADEVGQELLDHESDHANPHQVTAAQLADFAQAVQAVVGILAGNVTQDANHRFVTDALIAGWNGKESQGVAAALDAIQLAGLLDGVPAEGNTFQKLYNAIQLRAVQRQAATIAARNALSVKVGDWVNVDDDGDGRWAIYRATSNGVNATYNKVSDPDLLNAVMSAAQIRAGYLSNPGTAEFTTDLLAKLQGIQAGATANSTDAQLRDRATHTGTQAISTIAGLQAGLDGKATVDSHSVLAYAPSLTLDFAAADVLRTVSVTGDVSFAAAANKAAGKSKVVRLVSDGTAHALSFPAWTWQGAAAPTVLATGKVGLLSLTCFGAAESDVLAAYTVQP